MKKLTLNNFIEVLRSQGEDLGFSVSVAAKKGGEFVTFSRQGDGGKPEVRSRLVEAIHVKNSEAREEALKTLFGPKRTWNDTIVDLGRGYIKESPRSPAPSKQTMHVNGQLSATMQSATPTSYASVATPTIQAVPSRLTFAELSAKWEEQERRLKLSSSIESEILPKANVIETNPTGDGAPASIAVNVDASNGDAHLFVDTPPSIIPVVVGLADEVAGDNPSRESEYEPVEAQKTLPKLATNDTGMSIGVEATLDIENDISGQTILPNAADVQDKQTEQPHWDPALALSGDDVDLPLVSGTPDKNNGGEPESGLPVTSGDVVSQSNDLMGRLMHARIIAKGDTPQIVAEKVAAIVNTHSGVQDKNADGYVTPSKAAWLLQRPNHAFTKSAMTISLGHYRIWKAIDVVCQQSGAPRYSVNEFWGGAQEPVENPTVQIGRRIYAERILPLLELERNRHIQTVEQLEDMLELGSNAFRRFMGQLHFAYLRSDEKSPIGLTLEDIQQPDIIEPSGILSSLAETLGCENEEDIVPHSAWLDAVGVVPAESFRLTRFIASQKRLDESKLSAEAAAVMGRLRTRGFTDPVRQIVDALNERVAQAGLVPTKEYNIGVSTVAACIQLARPFGKWNKGYETITYRRITEIANEKGGDFTTESLFGVTRPEKLSPRQRTQNEAYNYFLEVLGQPQNRALLTDRRVASKAKLKARDVEFLFNDIAAAYENAGGQTQPNETLKRLSNALGCQPTEIIPIKLWQQAIPLSPKDVVTLDGGTTGSEDLDPELADLPPAFREQALKTRSERQAKEELPTARRALLSQLAAAQNFIIECGGDNATPLSILTAQPNTPSLEQVADNPPSSPQIAAPPKPSEAVIRALEPVGDAFVVAAVEVLKAYRALDVPDTAAEFSLLNSARGLNRKGQSIPLEEAATAIGSDNAQDAAEVLEEVEGGIIATVFKNTGVQLTAPQMADALRVYHKNFTGRIIVNKWLESGQDESHDENIGKTFASKPLRSDEVQGIRAKLLIEMAQALSMR